MKKIAVALIIILSFFLTYQPSFSAPSKFNPFQDFSIFLGPVVNTNRNSFHDYWLPGTGVEARIELPFYYGQIQGGIAYLPYAAESDDQPDFRSDFTYLGWGSDLIEIWNVQLGAGMKAGSFRFRFGGSEAEKYRQTEAEFCAGIYSGLALSVYDRWSVNVTASYLKIFTAERIELVFLSMGVTRTFTTPLWLRDFLK